MDTVNDPQVTTDATAYWTIEPRTGELRHEQLPQPGVDEARVRTLYSGISRGTESLVHAGDVPESVADIMRAPNQVGSFPFPVKYGYLNVGVVEDGPDSWLGRRVFSLFPHQDQYIAPLSSLTRLPDELPSRRALLAGAVETAINAIWDSPPLYGDRIAVVGSGLIGGSVAVLLSQFPVERLQIVDPDPAKEHFAQKLGLRAEWVHPDDALEDCDVVYHASASESGLATALSLLGVEGEMVELSWYGERTPQVPLGANFHARRLTIRASQVSQVAAARRARKTAADRMDLVLTALENPVFDELLGSDHSFWQLPDVMERLHSSTPSGRLEIVDYETT
ncbi:zinc-dependent alcohol dehydrogenase [Micrococcoides hystricis]|uniref:Zinc-binding alcohol dehydrogenase n=1 Tax=Micrococcoides hystricis TaxID=1572761 RepID=A0ABV6PCU4_9MICC